MGGLGIWTIGPEWETSFWCLEDWWRGHPGGTLCVEFAIPTLWKCGSGRALGGIWILIGLLVIASSNYCEMGHLKRICFLTTSFQGPSHTVSHVKIAGWHVRCQVQLQKNSKLKQCSSSLTSLKLSYTENHSFIKFY